MIDLETLYVPPELQSLPVLEILEKINFDNNFLMEAKTASGKTMVIPAMEALWLKDRGLTEITIYLRQPTKVAARSIYNSYRELYGEILDIGIMIQEEKTNVSGDIVIVSDGILQNIIKFKHKNDMIIYFDEVHVLQKFTEMEIAIAKKFDITVRFLTATIDPKQFFDYWPMLDYYQVEGRSFPIEYAIHHEKVGEKFQDFMEMFIRYISAEEKKALVFVPTRKECEDAKKFADKLNLNIETDYMHGGEDPRKVEKFMKDRHGAIVIFATIVAATSISIYVDEVLIKDQKINSKIRFGIEQVWREPVDNNTCRQMAGRSARFRKGKVTLYTYPEKNRKRGLKRRNWDDIQPTKFDLPLENTTPFEVVMMLAYYGMGSSEEFDFLSDLNYNELKYAREQLITSKIIKVGQEGKLELTHLGQKVRDIPLDFYSALFCVSMPIICNDCGYQSPWTERGRCLQCRSKDLNYVARAYALAGVICKDSFYYILDDRGSSKLFKEGDEWFSTKQKQPAISNTPTYYVRPDYVDKKCSMITKANILRAAFKAQDQHNQSTTLPKFCKDNNLNLIKIRYFLKNFYEASKTLGAGRTLKKSFIDNGMNAELTEIFIKTLKDLSVFPILPFYKGESEFETLWCITDNIEKEMMNLGTGSQKIMGPVRTMTSKKDNEFAIMWNLTIVTA